MTPNVQMALCNQTSVAHLETLSQREGATTAGFPGPVAASGPRSRRLKSVLLAGVALALPAVAALTPLAAQAASPNPWKGTTSNAWETGSNWTTGSAPTTTNAVTIGVTTNNPVQLNSNASLNATSGANVGSLTVGAGLGSTKSLNINSGFTLTMGTHAVTLLGGSITGLGTLSSTGTISGYGTISSLINGTTFSANATDGTTYTFSPSYMDGTPGTPITLIGQNNLTNDSFGITQHGSFDFQGVTLTTPTLTGVSTNLNAGPSGGNNTYGLLSFTGAASTVVGNVNNSNYERFNVTGTTLHLNNFSLTNSWATNAPAFFVIGPGGVVDNSVGNSNLTGHMAVIMNGGSLTNTGGGGFVAPGLITGTGLVSGPLTVTGELTANGGLLTVDGTAGSGIIAASTGWGAAGAGSTLDLKGNINFSPVTVGLNNFPAAPTLDPNGGAVQLDGATINTTGGSGQIWVNHGQVNVASGVNTLNGTFIPSGSDGTTASYDIKNGATLNLQNPTALKTAIQGTNFNMEQGSFLTTNSGNNAIQLSGNFSFQQTDTVNAWTHNGTAGLGPDLIMTGGSMATPVTLEAGGVNEGYVPAGFTDNFALDSLTVVPTAYIDVVDQFANATPSGWASGDEALYLDGLFGTSKTVYGTLNLGGLDGYLQGYGILHDGIFTDVNGDLVNIVNAGTAPAAPEATTITMMLAGFSALFAAAKSRRRKSEVAIAA